MQGRHSGILNAINNNSKRYSVLTFPTHEAYQSNWADMKHVFYMFQGKGIKTWNNKYRLMPENHVLLDGSESQIRPDMHFDIVLSQNKAAHWQVAASVATQCNLPLISLEHCLPFDKWTHKHIDAMNRMRGDVNVFISEYSCQKWGWDSADPSVRVIRHGIDINLFSNNGALHNDGKILTVMNDAINRTWCLGTDVYLRITKGLPVNPVGDTPGLSVAAKDTNDLALKYQSASVFLNTSKISPIPMSLLEAASCGCPIVTTATCAIPEVFRHNYNCIMSNDEKELRDGLVYLLENPDKAKELGDNARQTIIEQFSTEQHIKAWNEVFDSVHGRGYGTKN